MDDMAGHTWSLNSWSMTPANSEKRLREATHRSRGEELSLPAATDDIAWRILFSSFKVSVGDTSAVLGNFFEIRVRRLWIATMFVFNPSTSSSDGRSEVVFVGDSGRCDPTPRLRGRSGLLSPAIDSSISFWISSL